MRASDTTLKLPHFVAEDQHFRFAKVRCTNGVLESGTWPPGRQHIREEQMTRTRLIVVTSMVGLLLSATVSALAAKEITATEFSNSRSYSSAVSTEGGKIVWLAGEVALKDETGKSLVGDFEGQTRAIFASIEKTLAQHQGKLSDIVSMTVYITDARYGDKFVEIRKDIFKQNFPASTLVTVSGLSHPAMLIEVTTTAVIGSK